MYSIWDLLDLAHKNKVESNKAKKLLKLAMADLENAEDCDSCIYAYSPTGLCPANSKNGECEFKWKHHDEAMQLLGEEEQT